MTQLHLELHGASEYLNTPWSFGVNVSCASMLLKKEIQRHLIMGRDELGFKNVRFSGIFDEANSILQPDGSYNFAAIERQLDWLMEQGLSPFVVLDGVPAALTTEGSPLPADRDKWFDLCRALASFVDGRYGCDAQEWHFEVWPGADNPAVWPDSRESYFNFYDLAARAIKSVNPQLKVGGASAADADWTAAFIEHLAQPSEAFGLDQQRCDFVSVSGVSDGVANPVDIASRMTPVRAKLTESLGETMPLFLSTWSAGGRDVSADHDRCGAGAAVVGVAAATADLCTGMFYDCISDVDQSGDLRYEPFHGGRGLITINDVRKSSFNALKLLNEHLGYKMNWRWQEPADGLTALVTKDYHHVIRIVASYVPAGGMKPGPARFSLEGLPESVQYGQVQVLRPAAGSALESWVESGGPMFVNRYLLDDLEAASHPAMTEVNFVDFPPRLEAGMTLQLTIPLPDDVAMMD